MPTSKYIILDRDGVINQDSPAFIKNSAECHPIEGSIEAIARLSQSGWKVIVITNQSGIMRGLLTISQLSAIHHKLHTLVRKQGGNIDSFFFCPHTDDHNCRCRKPKPGLFYEVEKRYDISLAGMPNVGNSVRDLQAGAYVGCVPFFIHPEDTPLSMAIKTQLPPDTQCFPSLHNMVDALLDKRIQF